jgi:hypothetical protein
MYEFACPQCQRITTTINRMADSHVPPTKCSPAAERTEETGPDGKPVYIKHESCGYEGTELETELEDGTTRPGWKKLIGSTNFVINGYSFKNGYGTRW